MRIEHMHEGIYFATYTDKTLMRRFHVEVEASTFRKALEKMLCTLSEIYGDNAEIISLSRTSLCTSRIHDL